MPSAIAVKQCPHTTLLRQLLHCAATGSAHTCVSCSSAPAVSQADCQGGSISTITACTPPQAICVDGHSYEHGNISRWLADQKISPLTGANLASVRLYPNHGKPTSTTFWSLPWCPGIGIQKPKDQQYSDGCVLATHSVAFISIDPVCVCARARVVAPIRPNPPPGQRCATPSLSGRANGCPPLEGRHGLLPAQLRPRAPLCLRSHPEGLKAGEPSIFKPGTRTNALYCTPLVASPV